MINIVVQISEKIWNNYFPLRPLTSNFPAPDLPGYNTATLGSHMALVNSFP